MRNKIVILLLMIAGLGRAEEFSLRPDDVAVIKKALLHFASQTNYFNWSSTNAPVLLVELWSPSRRKSVHGETNRTDLIIIQSSRPSRSFPFWFGGKKTVHENGYGEEGKTTTIHPSTLASLLARHETDLGSLTNQSAIFKLVKDSNSLSFRDFADKYPEAKAWMDIWLPGFNDANDEAFLGFLFGPRHSASAALYKLKRTASGWTVTWFTFKYFV
ncbi:MAG: hypothetical protein EOM62_15225 [Bacteroidia bacterium]|nr:hypothetical protein [Bacteroidia bacterium]